MRNNGRWVLCLSDPPVQVLSGLHKPAGAEWVQQGERKALSAAVRCADLPEDLGCCPAVTIQSGPGMH